MLEAETRKCNVLAGGSRHAGEATRAVARACFGTRGQESPRTCDTRLAGGSRHAGEATSACTAVAH